MKKMLLLLIISFSLIFAQERTVGLLLGSDDAAEGYTLFAPNSSTSTYLVNNDGNLVHEWSSTLTPGQSVYLLENGNVLRTEMVKNNNFNAGGSGGRVKEISWEGEIMWQFDYSSNEYCQHHDIAPMPNGNVLVIAWEAKSRAEALAAGRKSSLLVQNELWVDHVVEIKPTGQTGGEIVWEWHGWDHLVQEYDAGKENYGVVADHPELVNLNFTQTGQNAGVADWMHINAIDYNAELDQIALSVRNFSEVWIIDHSTTTEQAAGHTGGQYGKGGDILYRFGNPQAFSHGTAADRILFVQHNAQWIPRGLSGAGNILVFNNGANGTTHNYSSVDEFVLPHSDGEYDMLAEESYNAPSLAWSYKADNPQSFYASNVSGAQRLQNGHTLVCNGPSGTFFEIDEKNDVIWEYVNPVTRNGIVAQGTVIGGGTVQKNNNVFRCTRYSPDYPAFDGKNMTPGAPIETYPASVAYSQKPVDFKLGNYPNPFNPQTTIFFNLPNSGFTRLEIMNQLGQTVDVLVNETLPAGEHQLEWDASHLCTGIYYYLLQTEHNSQIQSMTFVR